MYDHKYHVQYENALIHFQNQPFSKKKFIPPSKKIPYNKVKLIITNQIQHEKIFSLHKKNTHTGKKNTGSHHNCRYPQAQTSVSPLKYITYSFNLPLA